MRTWTASVGRTRQEYRPTGEGRWDRQAAQAVTNSGASYRYAMTTTGTLLTDRFDEALTYASAAHRTQLRKGTTIPYVAHLLAVASRVLEEGGDEEESIAALLHDAVEDQGGAARLGDIRARFGDRVASIVAGASDTDEIPKPPWHERKSRYIRHLASPETDLSVVLVSGADKLHNARSMLRDVRRSGPSTWSRFNAGADAQLWYYRSMREVFRRRLPGAMTDELSEVVDGLERAIQGPRLGRRHRTLIAAAAVGALGLFFAVRRRRRSDMGHDPAAVGTG